MVDVQSQFGPIDIYLFDQILRGRIERGMRILDAGCGGGRNLVYFLQQGFDVFGVDQDALAIEEVRRLAGGLSPRLPGSHFQVGGVEAMPYADAFFQVVISSAVLHFAQDDIEFRNMLSSMWRVLQPGGILFCRLASTIGMEKRAQRIKGRRCLLPDGSERYLVDAKLLEKLTSELRAELVDPIKTTLVHNQRSMTTWVIRKADL